MCSGLQSLPASLFSKHTSAQCHGANTPNEPDTDLDLDLQGSKHVNRQDNADALYWMQNGTGSAFIAFTDPGEASANAFRTFIQGHVPHHLIRDEYGNVTPIVQVSHDHLPTLQVQIWLQKSAQDTHTPCDGMASEMQVDKCGTLVQHKLHDTPQVSEDNALGDKMLSVVSHFAFIIGLLQSKYVFIHRKKPDRTCELPGCQKQSGTQPVLPTILSLEPLIHWATITPAADITLCRGRVQAFRRDGKMCSDPLWAQAIEKYTPQNAPSYCSDCLEMLMGNRVSIMASLDRSVSRSFTPINAQPAHLIEPVTLRDANGGFGKHFNNGVYQTVDRVDELPASRNSPAGHARAAPLNLDGACDVHSDEDSHNVVGSHCSVTSYDKASASHSYGNSPEGNSTSSATETPPLYDRSFTSVSPVSLSSTPPEDDIRSSRWATINNSPSLPTSPLNSRISFNPYDQTTPNSGLDGASNNRVESTLDNKNIVKTSIINTPSQPPTRAFGREINANAALSPLKMSKDTKTTKEHTKDIQSFLAPSIKTTQHQEEVANPPIATPPVNPFPNSHEAIDTYAGYLAHATTSPPRPHPKRKTKSPRQKNPPRPRIRAPTAPPPTTPSPGPFPAKFYNPRLPPCPPSISPATYAAYHARVPPPAEIICSCRAPASSTNIAQCANADCAIMWLHYGCLDKAAKLSARHGRLVCQVCRNEGYFRGGGGVVEEVVGRECKVAFEGWEMVVGVGVVRPYGMGVEAGVEEGGEGGEVRKGALGALGFMGYVESRPGVLVQAYEDGQLCVGAERDGGYDEDEKYVGYEEDMDETD